MSDILQHVGFPIPSRVRSIVICVADAVFEGPSAPSTYSFGQQTSHTRIRLLMSTHTSITHCKSVHHHHILIVLIPLPFVCPLGLMCNNIYSTSPSVYMIVNTIFGYNTAGRAGPSGTSVVFALDLDQVSTMVPIESVTRQLTLNDLGTDCPQMEAASVIATAAAGGRCDPILVAPEPVKSWASPCNACGAFGLFDPPYAVPPLQGGLVPGPTMTTMAQPEPQTTTSRVPATESTTTLAVTETTPDVTPIPTLTQLSSTSSVTTSNSVTSSSSSLGADPNPTTTPAMTASATKVAGGRACLILSLFVSIYLL